MRALTTPLQLARNLLASRQGWFLFVEVPRVAGGFFRLVNDNRHREANDCSWQACAMKIDLPGESADGDLSQGKVTIPNVSRMPIAAVELDDELLEQTATFYLQHESTLPAFVESLSWRLTILNVECNELAASFTCGHPAQTQRAPVKVYDRRTYPQLLRSGGISTLRRGTT